MERARRRTAMVILALVDISRARVEMDVLKARLEEQAAVTAGRRAAGAAKPSRERAEIKVVEGTVNPR